MINDMQKLTVKSYIHDKYTNLTFQLLNITTSLLSTSLLPGLPEQRLTLAHYTKQFHIKDKQPSLLPHQ